MILFMILLFGADASLLYTDTDLPILEVFADDFYRTIAANTNKFDTLNYHNENKFSIKKSELVLGRIKGEFPNSPITGFHGTGTKAYYIKSLNNELKKVNGIKVADTEKGLHLVDYRQIVEQGGLIFRKFKTFGSELHDVYTLIINKIALLHYDDKRYVIPSFTKTLPCGHTDIDFHKTDPQDNVKMLLQAMKSFL